MDYSLVVRRLLRQRLQSLYGNDQVECAWQEFSVLDNESVSKALEFDYSCHITLDSAMQRMRKNGLFPNVDKAHTVYSEARCTLWNSKFALAIEEELMKLYIGSEVVDTMWLCPNLSSDLLERDFIRYLHWSAMHMMYKYEETRTFMLNNEDDYVMFLQVASGVLFGLVMSVTMENLDVMSLAFELHNNPTYYKNNTIFYTDVFVAVFNGNDYLSYVIGDCRDVNVELGDGGFQKLIGEALCDKYFHE